MFAIGTLCFNLSQTATPELYQESKKVEIPKFNFIVHWQQHEGNSLPKNSSGNKSEGGYQKQRD